MNFRNMHESSNSGGNMPYMEEPPSYISLYPELANAGYSRPNLQVTQFNNLLYSLSSSMNLYGSPVPLPIGLLLQTLSCVESNDPKQSHRTKLFLSRWQTHHQQQLIRKKSRCDLLVVLQSM